MEAVLPKGWFSRSDKRKAPAVPPHPGPDDDGVSRVIPKEIWDGPQGDFLREIGASPDDSSNLMPTQAQVQARFDELRGQQDTFMAGINKEMPESVNLIPWAMIPWSVWSGPHADFLLVTCELYPVGPWNMMLLPDDDGGAFVLQLPKHPGGIPEGLESTANKVLGEIREEISQAHAHTGAAIAKGDLSALDDFKRATDEAVGNVQGLAHFLGSETYGEEACERHKKLFADSLGWGTGR